MAWDQDFGIDSLPCICSANATTIAQFTAVILDTSASSMEVIQATATSQPILGVNQSVGGAPAINGTPSAVTPGQSMMVRMFGVSKMVAGGAVSVGDFVKVDSSGRAVTGTLSPSTTATDTYFIGQALTASAATGDIISVLLMPGLTSQVTA